jgi:hypothetical protein
MTSQINPSNIDGNYPVAGQPNNTQGMRDNFTATKTNFQYASDEITALQNSSVLKQALGNTTLDNNMNDNLIYAVKLNDVSWVEVQQVATSGTITLDYSAANYQAIPSATGNITLAFSNWPAAGTVGRLNFAIVVSNTSYTLTLPATVKVGIKNLNGISPGTAGVTNTITFPATGTYVYVLETSDGGSTISIQETISPTNDISNQVVVSNATPSTSTSSGALIVTGGAGIGGNIFVGGRLSVAGNVYTTGITSDVGNITTSAGNILITGGVGGTGYGSGAGGTVSQSGNKSGGVTLNKQTGEITMQSTALASATTVNFVLTNSTISATDLLLINQSSTANSGGYVFNAICNSGNANIAVRNVMAASASDAVVLRFAVIKGATS